MKDFQTALEQGLIASLEYITQSDNVDSAIKVKSGELHATAIRCEAVRNSVLESERVMPFEHRPLETQEILNRVHSDEQEAWDWLEKFVRYNQKEI